MATSVLMPALRVGKIWWSSCHPAWLLTTPKVASLKPKRVWSISVVVPVFLWVWQSCLGRWTRGWYRGWPTQGLPKVSSLGWRIRMRKGSVVGRRAQLRAHLRSW